MNKELKRKYNELIADENYLKLVYLSVYVGTFITIGFIGINRAGQDFRDYGVNSASIIFNVSSVLAPLVAISLLFYIGLQYSKRRRNKILKGFKMARNLNVEEQEKFMSQLDQYKGFMDNILSLIENVGIILSIIVVTIFVYSLIRHKFIFLLLIQGLIFVGFLYYLGDKKLSAKFH